MSTSRWSLVSRFAPNSLPGAESPSQQVEVPHGSTMPQEGLEELGLKLWPWWASKDRGKQGHTFNLMCCAGVPNNFTRLLTNTQFFSLSIAKSREREREREKVKQKEREVCPKTPRPRAVQAGDHLYFLKWTHGHKAMPTDFQDEEITTKNQEISGISHSFYL